MKNRSNGYGDAADYNKDDTITYKVVVDVPTNIVKLQKFVLTDTPTNLTDDSGTVKVYSDEAMNVVAPENIYSVKELVTVLQLPLPLTRWARLRARNFMFRIQPH